MLHSVIWHNLGQMETICYNRMMPQELQPNLTESGWQSNKAFLHRSGMDRFTSICDIFKQRHACIRRRALSGMFMHLGEHVTAWHTKNCVQICLSPATILISHWHIPITVSVELLSSPQLIYLRGVLPSNSVKHNFHPTGWPFVLSI